MVTQLGLPMTAVESPEWCPDGCHPPVDGYAALSGVPGNVFVHSCGRPAFLVWQSYEKTCDECGCSFSSAWESVCERCHYLLIEQGFAEDRLYLSWSGALESTVMAKPNVFDLSWQ